MFKAMLIAGAGGFIGTCLRYLVGKLAHYVFSSPFPWGTFAVNIIGSFVIGIFFGMAEKAHLISANISDHRFLWWFHYVFVLCRRHVFTDAE